ncbi:Bug family tripartite tricarboxylate transporter substrate binding protein [Bordetella petrii]|uniref:Secreted protein n=1 Tax=Bordetella petrii (strain ATCC BAA-461 / DSM 12804 / CCUG 43448 / CIP 107267 / Se-1111R) TaxID=340100 RepID=A9I356_BORPD|nr:tripartite tricarboxylate transporter substrate binding protein [Bordetella petrii]CAP44132.1 putative secreted protein [Bordetella petrii]
MIKKFTMPALIAATLMAGNAVAAYPERPIVFVVPYTAGGITDNVARTAAAKLEKELGQTVIVENRSGAGGSIGADYVLRQPADGYTIFLGTQGTQITNPLIYDSTKYDAQKDFVAIHGLTAIPNVVVVNSQKPYQTLDALVQYAKTNPGALTNSSAGTGSGTHLAAELFQDVAGVSFTHVPYKGSAPSITDLMGGQVDLSFDYLVSTRGGITEGRLKPVAVTGEARLPDLPDIPTMTELGYPKATSVSWMGAFVRAGTPQDAIDTLTTAFEKIIADPDVAKAYANFGGATLNKPGSEFAHFISEETEKWSAVVKAVGLEKGR